MMKTISPPTERILVYDMLRVRNEKKKIRKYV